MAAKDALEVTDVLDGFHPAVRAWFRGQFEAPTPPQLGAWPAIREGKDTLIAAPTGSGKTLSAFLAAIDALVVEAQQGPLPQQTRVLYVSPLKALSRDIDDNLAQPLAGTQAHLAALGCAPADIRTMVRTGDTPARERALMLRRPPHIVVSTPESLFILLTSEGGRRLLSTVRTVIVDEIHALIGDKRGSHLSLSLERLQHLVDGPLTRIGLSATQRPIETVAQFLVGPRRPLPVIVDGGHLRNIDVDLELPSSPLEAVMSGEVWEEIYDRVATLVRSHRTTLIFVNTRRLAERLTRHLEQRLGEGAVTAHHGSLAKERRLDAEQRLKAGVLTALVATGSLELGIDIGSVDLVCQLGSTKRIATFLQRVGRAGHQLGAVPKGRLFPLSRDDLVECSALLLATRTGQLDLLEVPEAPLDILAQQIVASAATDAWDEDALLALVRSSYAYRNLTKDAFEQVVQMLAEGFATRRGRRGARIHRDAVNGRIRGRRGAGLAAMTSGGAIPDNADYEVILEPGGHRVGSINEDFAIESMQGDIFQLGNSAWRIVKVEPGTVRVHDAHGLPPTIPFWLGEAPARTTELSVAVSELRQRVDVALGEFPEDDPAARAQDITRAIADLVDAGIISTAAEQLVEYLAGARAALGVMPTRQTLVLERFFDDSGGMQLVIHSPYGARINRAWGLSLRKKFCQRFNFELQAAALEDAIVLSLGPTHSFPLQDVFDYVKPQSARDALEQAVLPAPMFASRWRWNAGRSLAVLRFRGGKKVPPRFQRMDADDLMTVVFPDQVACQDNLTGPRQVVDHPLVNQTMADCFSEAMDFDRFIELLEDIAGRRVRLVARDLTEPSPLSAEILTARPHAFLDDAPLEERRTQAVMTRRWVDPKTASDLGRLDAAAIARVCAEAWPDAANADELHDALLVQGFFTESEAKRHGLIALLQTLGAAGRAGRMTSGAAALWIGAERLDQFRAVYPDAQLQPPLRDPGVLRRSAMDRQACLVELVGCRMDVLGPTTAAQLAAQFALPVADIDLALLALESQGTILRGRFSPDAPTEQWCERRLLARIHRQTLSRLRAEIAPVTTTEFMRFLLAWQHVEQGYRAQGPLALEQVLTRLNGFEAPAAAWETEILPRRLQQYAPQWLDDSCLSGRTVWARISPPAPQTQPQLQGSGDRPISGPIRSTPVALATRASYGALRGLSARAQGDDRTPGEAAARIEAQLLARGACFSDDLGPACELSPQETVDALAELVTLGRVNSDGFAGLRGLLSSSGPRERGRSHHRDGASHTLATGRWALLPFASDLGIDSPARDAALAQYADCLLQRYGVVFRRLLEREACLVPWRQLLGVYRRLEARGEVRGGRFVDGFSGEQFALPGAIPLMREARRRRPTGRWVTISGADPLNLGGILLPGERIPALTGNRLLLRDGELLGRRIAGEVSVDASLAPDMQREAEARLRGDDTPTALGARLGRSA